MEYRVPKFRRMKFRPRGITQKNEYKKYYIFCVCICSLIYPARDVHAPNSHLWPAFFTKFFPNCLINGTIFKEKVTEPKIYFDFPYNFCPKQW